MEHHRLRSRQYHHWHHYRELNTVLCLSVLAFRQLWVVMSNHLNGERSRMESISKQKPVFNTPVLEGIYNMNVSGLRQKLDSQDSPKSPKFQKPNPASWNGSSVFKRSLVSTLIHSIFKADKEIVTIDFGNVLNFFIKI